MGIKTIVIIAAILIFGHIAAVIVWLIIKIRKGAERDTLRRKKSAEIEKGE